MAYKVMDLFAGAGGLSNGFEQTKKFEIVVAVENNSKVKETYKKNHKDTVLMNDVRKMNYKDLLSQYGNIDVIIGGPPCQGFSNANRQKNHMINSNNQLIKEYIRAINSVKPKVFVMENVSMLSSTKHKFYNSFIDKEHIETLDIKMSSESLKIELPKAYAKKMHKDIIAGHMFYKYAIPEKIFRTFNTIYKKRKNPTGLKEAYNRKSDEINKAVEFCMKYYEEMDSNDYVKILYTYLKKISELIRLNNIKFLSLLEDFVLFQRSFYKLAELSFYKLIVERYSLSENILQIEVKSYAVIEYIKKSLEADYTTVEGILNASHFGVPQNRERFIMIGIKSDSQNTDLLALPWGFIEKENAFTVKDAIYDLESYDPKQEITATGVARKKSKNKSSKLMNYLCDCNIIYNHVNTKSTEVAVERFKKLKQGQNFHDLDNKFKSTYSLPERTQNSIYLRLDYNKPSGTVLNVRKSMWIHPTIDRALSIREAARLQSFPDSFIFTGSKDSQYQQIGNAVPPLLGRAIAEKVLELLGDVPKTSIRDILSN